MITRETSFAELSLRGLEYLLSVYTAEPGIGKWQPPKPRQLGWKGLSDARLKGVGADHRRRSRRK
ncbi:MAG: hypothetical protein J0M24_26115 [Verrucomicrobia bacterium]|nr:hypothetical protein [Verrucomicrobiota bacterium]